VNNTCIEKDSAGSTTRSTSYGVYISQLIRFPRASSSMDDFNKRNQIITEKL